MPDPPTATTLPSHPPPVWRRVILESPFAGATPEARLRNLAYARLAVRDCLSRGEAPLASHLLYTQPGILDDSIPAERAYGIAAGRAWRDYADAIVFYTDLGVSKGMQQMLSTCLQEARLHLVEFRSLVGHVLTIQGLP